MTSAQKAVLLHPMGSMGEAAERVPIKPDDFWLHVRGCDCDYCTWERANGGDALHRAAVEWHEEQDRAEIERINLTGARYRESVRLEKLGELPWDFAAGESA